MKATKSVKKPMDRGQASSSSASASAKVSRHDSEQVFGAPYSGHVVPLADIHSEPREWTERSISSLWRMARARGSGLIDTDRSLLERGDRALERADFISRRDVVA